eukprot:PhF_6_TR43388/c0_g1_i1/m.66594/K05546/GANAB; alpha 1,3-glucosidase
MSLLTVFQTIVFFSTVVWSLSTNLPPSFSRRGGTLNVNMYPNGAVHVDIATPATSTKPPGFSVLKGHVLPKAKVVAEPNRYVISHPSTVAGDAHKVDSVEVTINRDQLGMEFKVQGATVVTVKPESPDANQRRSVFSLSCARCTHVLGGSNGIPYVLGHHKGYTFGIVSLNPSATDIYNVTATTYEVNAESGGIEFVFLPGPLPEEVQKQFSNVLGGLPTLPPLWSLGFVPSEGRLRDVEYVRRNNIPVELVTFADVNVTNKDPYSNAGRYALSQLLKDVSRLSFQGAKHLDVFQYSSKERVSIKSLGTHLPSHFLSVLKKDANTGQNTRRQVLLSDTYALGESRTPVTIKTGSSWDELRGIVVKVLQLSFVGATSFALELTWGTQGLTPELVQRWFQVSSVLPFFSLPTWPKASDPKIEKDITKRVRKAIAYRYRLSPYLYTCMFHQYLTGAPIVQPVFFHSPFDDFYVNKAYSYLLGSNLLVRPVVEEDPKMVLATLPGKGRAWYVLDTGVTYSPDTIERMFEVDQHPLPTLIRAGGIVATTSTLRRNITIDSERPMTLYIALNGSQSSSGDLYLDDGITTKYQRGHFIHRQFDFAHGQLTSKLYSSYSYYAQDRTTQSRSFRTKSVIEKLVIYGLEFPISKVEIVGAKGTRTSLPFKMNGHIGVVPKLRLDLNIDWRLAFEF